MYGSRRQFIEQAGLLAGGALLPIWGQSVRAQTNLGGDPFTLGVASGDPASDGMVLWTRLAPKPLDADGGMPAEAVKVGWEIAEDEHFSKVVRQGIELARPQAAHSVHVEVDGLRPDRPYFYRFTVGQEQSPVGRTRTTPLAGADVQALRYAFTACQNYEANNYAPYRQMVADDPALILFLGDYIYEHGGKEGLVRRHPDEEAHDLRTYRLRYAVYKSDPLLQAAHAAAPWMVIWDDHEVKNNYRADREQDGSDPAAFLLRRAAAYQAYYEHMPLRRRSIPVGPAMQLYRSLDWGRLAQFQFLDTRQYRDFTPCFAKSYGHNLVENCDERLDPKRSLLGMTQEKWLFDTLRGSSAKWNVLAQQYIMAEIRRLNPKTGNIGFMTDGWDGEPASRSRVLKFWRDAKISNPLAIGGDTHAFVASDLRDGPGTPVIGSAFVGGSLASTSQGDMAETRSLNPDIRFGDNQRRGYTLVDLTPKENHLTYKAALDSRDANSTTSAIARFVIEDGRPGFTIT